MKGKKLINYECEICGIRDLDLLQRHHIKERTEIDTNNSNFNLCVICSNCHVLVHKEKTIKIIGIFPSSKPPNGRSLIFEKCGVSNLEGVKEAYYEPKANAVKINKGNK